jgi:DNA-binding MarR family transcriptional regulator
MPSHPRPAAYGRFWFDARKVVAMADSAIDKRLRAEVGISQTMYLLLSVVDVDIGSFNQKEVASLLATTGATVSRQVEAAASHGYLVVSISETSRRDNVITLTPRGRQIVAAGDAVVLEESERLLGTVDADDFAVAMRTMAVVLKTAAARARDIAPA